jgi:acyl-CoA reductase-like NAD-dependent aldehyde dehydrogenase
MLHRSVEYAIGCNAAKSAMVVDSGKWHGDAADYLSTLVVGDPLDSRTQVGFVNPQNLNYLEQVLQQYAGRLECRGMERLSPVQARPLLIRTHNDIPELFGQEIPAYVLTVRNCDTVDDAVRIINQYTGNNMRLAVSFLHVNNTEIENAIPKIKAHAILVNEPTTTVVPFFHEGNDYALKQVVAKLLIMEPFSR